MQKEMKRTLPLPLVLLLAGSLAFFGLYRWDNKYQTALPGGPGYNVLAGDGSRVAFLVDGWEYYPGQLLTPQDLARRTAEVYTYIGEWPNFAPHLDDPCGAATYCLTLENRGGARELALYLPELLCAGRVYINGELVGEQGSLEPYRPLVMDGTYAFPAGERTQLVVQCANYTHYYSGMYYPPAVGTPTAVARMVTARMMVYGLLCFVSLGLALSSLALWLFDRDAQSFRLGLLCLAFALRVCYPFLRALGIPMVRPLYALEDLCGNVALLCAVLLAGELSGATVRRYHRFVAIPGAATLCAVSVVFPLFILPYTPLFINTYGVALSLWRLAAGGYLLFLSARGLASQRPLSRYLLCASGLYGLSIAASVILIGRFEPIRGAWSEEYGGFALVLGFGALMVHRGALVTAENRRLSLNLQEEVARKTQTLEALMAERRELLAHLLHDIKNPLTALQNYAQLIQAGGVALDEKTSAYLDALRERAGAVEARFGLLQDFSRGERGATPSRPIALKTFLERFYTDNRPDMELSGQRFCLELPDEELTVRGDEERLRSALENLCYNALSFTPEDGTITLSLRRQEDQAVITVADTGAGIDPQDLPHIFDYGFTRRPVGGDGLGLFIVQSVALELGGAVEATSTPGQGSTFTLHLPLAKGAE